MEYCLALILVLQRPKLNILAVALVAGGLSFTTPLFASDREVSTVIVEPQVTENHASQRKVTEHKITKQQARVLTILSQTPMDDIQVKHLSLQASFLTDNQGRTYLGAIVNREQLLPYLAQLKTILTTEFEEFRANQAVRDHQIFHLTLVNPIEYQQFDTKVLAQWLSSEDKGSEKNLLAENMADSSAANALVNLDFRFQVTLVGLGKAEQVNEVDKLTEPESLTELEKSAQATVLNKRTYFVVAQSHQAQLFRQRLSLNNKDFHVTLGFAPTDIYGVKKDSTSLITPKL